MCACACAWHTLSAAATTAAAAAVAACSHRHVVFHLTGLPFFRRGVFHFIGRALRRVDSGADALEKRVGTNCYIAFLRSAPNVAVNIMLLYIFYNKSSWSPLIGLEINCDCSRLLDSYRPARARLYVYVFSPLVLVIKKYAKIVENNYIVSHTFVSYLYSQYIACI